ncbi:choice-of-anchor A family protein [Cystobacter fuscus]
MSGSSANVNVFEVDGSAFTSAKVLSLEAPANSLAVINIRGASASFTRLGQRFTGGITEQGVLFNFADATSISSTGYSFLGTVLAPRARVSLTGGGWRGGFYAQSLTGGGSGYLSRLRDTDICP